MSNGPQRKLYVEKHTQTPPPNQTFLFSVSFVLSQFFEKDATFFSSFLSVFNSESVLLHKIKKKSRKKVYKNICI